MTYPKSCGLSNRLIGSSVTYKKATLGFLFVIVAAVYFTWKIKEPVIDNRSTLFTRLPDISPINGAYPLKEKNQRSFKIILYWTPWYGGKPNFPMGQKPFLDANCQVNNCYITYDKSYARESSAIIFHMWDIGSSFPKPRLPHQNWVFYNRESPSTKPLDLKWLKGMFNLTITYRSDSDFVEKYGKVSPSYKLINESLQVLNSPKKDLKPLKDKKPVAWFVSDCNTTGKRDDYVKELNKYIPVDIYGCCGSLKCDGKGSDSCYKMLEKDYKFYLSFENSMCKDYVTEKVFNILRYDVVPVVLGLADYDKLLPPGSFVNALDFESPKKLAEYLSDLCEDELKYKQFFEWKSMFDISDRNLQRNQLYCDLCEYINKPNLHKVYDDIDAWWNTGTCDNDLVKRQMKNW